MEIEMRINHFTNKIPASNAGKIFFIFLLLFVFSGCASKVTHGPDDSEIKTKLIDKRLSAVEEKMDKLYNRLSIIQFMVDSHEQKIKTSSEASHTKITENKSENLIKTSSFKEIKEENLSPQKLYAKGYDYLKDKNYSKSIETFDEFLKKYPHETLADNSMYWKGEAFYALSDYEKAAKIFESVASTYPDGTKCPDALLKAGYSHLKLKNNEKAKLFFQKVIKNYPFSNAASKAQLKLKEIL